MHNLQAKLTHRQLRCWPAHCNSNLNHDELLAPVSFLSNQQPSWTSHVTTTNKAGFLNNRMPFYNFLTLFSRQTDTNEAKCAVKLQRNSDCNACMWKLESELKILLDGSIHIPKLPLRSQCSQCLSPSTGTPAASPVAIQSMRLLFSVFWSSPSPDR